MSLLFSGFLFSGGVYAEGELNQIIESKSQNKSVKKKTRRKKVEMCHECGKPEPECECEGHGDGHKEDEHKDH